MKKCTRRAECHQHERDQQQYSPARGPKLSEDGSTAFCSESGDTHDSTPRQQYSNGVMLRAWPRTSVGVRSLVLQGAHVRWSALLDASRDSRS